MNDIPELSQEGIKKVSRDFISERQYLVVYQIIIKASGQLLAEAFAYADTYEQALDISFDYALRLKCSGSSEDIIRTFIFQLNPNPIFENEI